MSKSRTHTLNFEVLIDEAFCNVNTDQEITSINNKNVLSIINDFQDGDWRYSKFQNFIWDNIKETALSSKERENLVDESHTKLNEAARNLRLTDSADDPTKGSELAEVVLYGIMKHYYKALPVVPKIFYKQNAQDFAKGADSIHIVIEGDKDFTIWFGEAKFYNNIEDARLSKIIESVENLLKSDKLSKENSIITSVSDLDYLITDQDLNTKIREALSSKASLDDLKPKLNIPILLLHECEITNSAIVLNDTYRSEIIAYHTKRSESYFKQQINKIGGTLFKYSDITFHIILFPVPLKSKIVDKFLSNVEHYKNQ